IVLAIAFVISGLALSPGWTAGLTLALAIAGVWVMSATARGWQEWRLFDNTAIETTGAVVQRIHEEKKGEYGGTYHEYFLVVQFTGGQQQIAMKERVDHSRYSRWQEGSSLFVRYAPSKPELARFRWDKNAASPSPR
ncbi:MAG: hypothetical protein QF477_09500, partial [SAR202 cluster bacterium]|nr:hypothetical protein [SAR202 cluster bacterium]